MQFGDQRDDAGQCDAYCELETLLLVGAPDGGQCLGGEWESCGVGGEGSAEHPGAVAVAEHRRAECVRPAGEALAPLDALWPEFAT
jgi:hypothetical protein